MPRRFRGVEVLRTPDERFTGLPDWPYAARYLHRPDGLRLAYLDEGPREAGRAALISLTPSWYCAWYHDSLMVPRRGKDRTQ